MDNYVEERYVIENIEVNLRCPKCKKGFLRWQMGKNKVSFASIKYGNTCEECGYLVYLDNCYPYLEQKKTKL